MSPPAWPRPWPSASRCCIASAPARGSTSTALDPRHLFPHARGQRAARGTPRRQVHADAHGLAASRRRTDGPLTAAATAATSTLPSLPHQWSQIAAALGKPELVDDPRFKDARARRDNNEAIRVIIEDWLAASPIRDEAVAVLEKHRVPCAPILTLNEAATHPHLRERGTVRSVSDPQLGAFDIPGLPVKFSGWTAAEGIVRRCARPAQRGGSQGTRRPVASRDRRALRTASPGKGYGTEESGGLTDEPREETIMRIHNLYEDADGHIALPGHRGRMGRAAARQPALQALPSDRARLPQGLCRLRPRLAPGTAPPVHRQPRRRRADHGQRRREPHHRPRRNRPGRGRQRQGTSIESRRRQDPPLPFHPDRITPMTRGTAMTWKPWLTALVAAVFRYFCRARR